ncbi:MAG: agmatine deiminase family protein, partial [Acidobacteriota bacterium]
MPAEWYRHESTWLSWPKDPQTWPERVPQVQETYIRLMAALTAHERVDLLVDDHEIEEEVRRRLTSAGVQLESVRFHPIQTVDAWIRDYGPNFLLREADGRIEPAYNDWKFNAWGGKYPELIKDSDVPAKLEPTLQMPRFEPGIVLEGGSIDVNGAGTCLTTEQCLLNSNRNPQMSKKEIEQHLKDFLGVEQVIWLAAGIAGDDTDGHIDDIARFVDPETIVCALAQDPADENYQALQDNYQRLQRARSLQGRPFQIVPLPMPQMLQGSDGPLPASYANFYIANGVVLLPVFQDPNDQPALEILQKLFPTRRVIGINCKPLVWGMGTIHCLTQQQPGARYARGGGWQEAGGKLASLAVA